MIKYEKDNDKNEIELNGKFPTSISWGENYHEMEDITEKFVG